MFATVQFFPPHAQMHFCCILVYALCYLDPMPTPEYNRNAYTHEEDPKSIIQIFERWCINKIIERTIQKLLIFAGFFVFVFVFFFFCKKKTNIPKNNIFAIRKHTLMTCFLFPFLFLFLSRKMPTNRRRSRKWCYCVSDGIQLRNVFLVPGFTLNTNYNVIVYYLLHAAFTNKIFKIMNLLMYRLNKKVFFFVLFLSPPVQLASWTPMHFQSV